VPGTISELTALRCQAQNFDIVKIKRPYHHGALRDALITAAAELLAEHGPSGVSLREAARRAGVSQAAPYHYFASKAALIAAAGEAGSAELDARARAALARAGSDPVGRIAALVSTYIRFALDQPHAFHTIGPRVAERFSDAVREARLARGHDDLDPSAMATLLWAVPHGLVSLYLSGPDTRLRATPVQIEQSARAAIDALLAIPSEDVAAEWAV
jgi:AcrR family transcriptional regulator